MIWLNLLFMRPFFQKKKSFNKSNIFIIWILACSFYQFSKCSETLNPANVHMVFLKMLRNELVRQCDALEDDQAYWRLKSSDNKYNFVCAQYAELKVVFQKIRDQQHEDEKALIARLNLIESEVIDETNDKFENEKHKEKKEIPKLCLEDVKKPLQALVTCKDELEKKRKEMFIIYKNYISGFYLAISHTKVVEKYFETMGTYLNDSLQISGFVKALVSKKINILMCKVTFDYLSEVDFFKKRDDLKVILQKLKPNVNKAKNIIESGEIEIFTLLKTVSNQTIERIKRKRELLLSNNIRLNEIVDTDIDEKMKQMYEDLGHTVFHELHASFTSAFHNELKHTRDSLLISDKDSNCNDVSSSQIICLTALINETNIISAICDSILKQIDFENILKDLNFYLKNKTILSTKFEFFTIIYDINEKIYKDLMENLTDVLDERPAQMNSIVQVSIEKYKSINPCNAFCHVTLTSIVNTLEELIKDIVEALSKKIMSIVTNNVSKIEKQYSKQETFEIFEKIKEVAKDSIEEIDFVFRSIQVKTPEKL